ncbi:MAG: response regulator receiver protein [Deltaproteobacteria bacterium]|jgi:two-component system NtrC family response regulator|nr:response regulator receiver protein [Deltaproteobacteria bacterium]
MDKPTLLVVDDHEHILKQLSWALSNDFTVHTATSKEAAIAAIGREQPALMTVDLALGPDDSQRRQGFEVLQEALCVDPAMKVIVITSDQEEATAIEAVTLGAFDYFVKPLPLDDLRVALRRAAYLGNLHRQARGMAEPPQDDGTGMIGNSATMLTLRQRIRRVAATDLTALVLGESGVGKELVARAIANFSTRQNQPYVVVNCAAIPDTLLETELFGHEKGSFTGAHAQKKGKFELADHGTLFLDEIGDLNPELQAKLLRFLQERSIERLGSNRPIQLDVRIVAATNRDLERAVQDTRFREDLYYRLKVLPVRVPPLRERDDDVLVLARYFLEQLARDMHTPAKRLAHETEAALRRHQWPGNVRELENVVKSGAVTCRGAVISAKDLDLEPVVEPPRNLRLARDELERDLIERALRRNDGVISRAARDLSISRVTLYDLLTKHGLRVPTGDEKAQGY